ncbi:MAG: hypothetical protein KGJ66_02395 [Alphaproteobacteria bacterium]|nr:hypothetical protein [Alphaproteobacteria bacterium]
MRWNAGATCSAKRAISSFTLVLHLLVRLQADVEIEDHLAESGGLDLLQRVGDLLRGAQQHRILGQVLGAHLTEPVHHVDEIAIARRRRLRIAGQRRNDAFAVIKRRSSAPCASCTAT